MSSTTFTRIKVELREMGFVPVGRNLTSGPGHMYQEYCRNPHVFELYVVRMRDGSAHIRLGDYRPVLLNSEYEWVEFRDNKLKPVMNASTAGDPIRVSDD